MSSNISFLHCNLEHKKSIVYALVDITQIEEKIQNCWVEVVFGKKLPSPARSVDWLLLFCRLLSSTWKAGMLCTLLCESLGNGYRIVWPMNKLLLLPYWLLLSAREKYAAKGGILYVELLLFLLLYISCGVGCLPFGRGSWWGWAERSAGYCLLG